MIKFSPQMKKILIVIILMILIGIVIYLIVNTTSKSNKTTSSRRLRSGGMILENYENIVLQVTSSCPSGTVFNTAQNRCSISSDFSIPNTTLPTVLLGGNTNIMGIDVAKTTDKFYKSPSPLDSNNEFLINATTAPSFVAITDGRKITDIPLINISTLFMNQTSIQDFINQNKSLIIMGALLKGNSFTNPNFVNTNTFLTSNILNDPNTTFTVINYNAILQTATLRIISKWSSPNSYVGKSITDSSCTQSGNSWINYLNFDNSVYNATASSTNQVITGNIYAINIGSATIKGNIFVNPNNTTNPNQWQIPCTQNIDCVISLASTTAKVIKSTTNPNTYTFTVTLLYNINSNAVAGGKTCIDTSLYPNYVAGRDTITSTTTQTTLNRTVTISYSNTSDIISDANSTGLQLLGNKATTMSADATFINNTYGNLFEEFFGDISSLPVLILTAVGSNKVFNTTQGGLVTTNIIGRRLYGQDLDISTTDNQSKIKTMVNRMTGLDVNSIIIAGIFNTFNIKYGNLFLSANSTGDNVTFTSNGDNNALWTFIRDGANNYLQHIVSSEYIPNGTVTGNITSLNPNRTSAAKVTSNIFTVTNGIITLTTGNIQLDSLFLGINTTTNNATFTTTATNFVSVLAEYKDLSLLTSLDPILNKQNWVQLPTGSVTPATVALDGKGNAIFNNNIFSTTGNNLNIYQGLNNLTTAKSIPSPVGGNLQNVFWDNSASLSTAGNVSGVGWQLTSNGDSYQDYVNVNVFNGANQWQIDGFYATSLISGGWLGQYQWVLTNNGAGARFMTGGTKDLNGAYNNVTGNVMIANNVNRFSTWANQTAGSQEIRILASSSTNTTNNLRLFTITDATTLVGKTFTTINLSTPFVTNWVAFTGLPGGAFGFRALVTDTNNNLYYAPNILISNPAWMKVNTPEPVSVVDFKNNYAAIISTTGKLYVANNF